MYTCNDIRFNHESSLGGEPFVTCKILRAVARIALGLQECLYLGNLSALRHWGHARDYVEMQGLMLQQPIPEDFVIATDVQVSVRRFVELACVEFGITAAFSGEGVDEIGTVVAVAGDGLHCRAGDVIVRVDPRYFRPTEVETLLGDASKGRGRLGWTPKTPLAELVREMVHSDHAAARRDSLVKDAGFRAYDHRE
jgi:GDPmannose 4,6-dehydratase